MIDHSLFMAKLLQYDINPYIMNWIAAFFSKRQQRVKLGSDSFSEWRSVHAGVPQGTKLDPWLFLVMLNYLSADTSNGVFKYVDDTTVYEILEKKESSHAKSILDEASTWSANKKFQLHPGNVMNLG